jgi:hypothetical protein
VKDKTFSSEQLRRVIKALGGRVLEDSRDFGGYFDRIIARRGWCGGRDCCSVTMILDCVSVR